MAFGIDQVGMILQVTLAEALSISMRLNFTTMSWKDKACKLLSSRRVMQLVNQLPPWPSARQLQLQLQQNISSCSPLQLAMQWSKRGLHHRSTHSLQGA